MIRATSSYLRLTKQIKLFNIRSEESEKERIKKIFQNLISSNPKGSRLSINFFKDGENIYGEALLGYRDICVLSRKMGSDLLEVAEKVENDIKRKFLNSKRMHAPVYGAASNIHFLQNR